MNSTNDCKGCGVSVRLAAGEVERIVAQYLASHPSALVDEGEYARRLTICESCADLRYGTTCRHCGCLVAVRAKLAEKDCPASGPRW